MGVESGEMTAFINFIQLIYNNCAKWYVILNRSHLLIINKQILLIYYINSLFYTLEKSTISHDRKDRLKNHLSGFEQHYFLFHSCLNTINSVNLKM